MQHWLRRLGMVSKLNRVHVVNSKTRGARRGSDPVVDPIPDPTIPFVPRGTRTQGQYAAAKL
jgi:hypothetical protein